MASKVSAAHTLCHPIASKAMAIDHRDKLPLFKDFTQISILAGVHSNIIHILEKPRVHMVLGSPARCRFGESDPRGVAIPEIV